MGYIKRQNVILGTLLGFAFVSPTFAQSEPGFYLGLGIGPTLVSDVDLELRSGGASETASLSAEPGVRFDLAPGYRVNENLAVEFNTGVLWNGLDEVEAGGGSANLEGDLIQVPLLVNAVGSFPVGDSGFTPFVSAGGGGIYEYLAVDRVAGTQVDDSGDDLYGAFQAGAGVNYQIADTWSVGVAYKYLHAFTSESGTIPGFGTYELDDLSTHSISVLFTLNY